MSLYHTLKEKLFPKDAVHQTPQFQMEGQMRDSDRTDALAMCTADPLWMLGRQWQFGEFQGEDNGSPIQVKTNCKKATTEFLSVGRNSTTRIPIKNRPPEFLVEAMEFHPTDLRSKVRIGQRFEQSIKNNFTNEKALLLINNLRSEYPLHYENAMDAKSKRFLKLMQGKVIDGCDLIQQILAVTFPYDRFPELGDLANDLKAWHLELFPSPAKDKAWNSTQLSHRFQLHQEATDNSKDLTLNAPDYQSGQLDWFTFDSADIKPTIKRTTETIEQLTPVNAAFSFMPEKRLFAFENNQLDLSKMEFGTDDLIKLMILDFSLVSGSDWFTVPVEMNAGELCWIESVEVKDVFGVKTIIENDGKKGSVLDGNPLHVWDIFKIRNDKPISYESLNHFLFLSPSATMRLESTPIEELLFYRDEYANMVWAQERTIQNAMGTPRDGYELHLELNGAIPPRENYNNEIPKFRLASAIPTHWIPYLPFQASENNFNIELHRAKVLRNETDKEPTDIEPLTFLASKDLKTIREEAIPRDGVRVQITKQRTRWTDGKTYVWKGRKVLTGNGEGNSGLRFDYLD